jgi:hypothetical protein
MYIKRPLTKSDSAAKNAPAIISSHIIHNTPRFLIASGQALKLGGFNLPIEKDVNRLSSDDDALATGRGGDELVLRGGAA